MLFLVTVKNISKQMAENLARRAWANNCSIEQKGGCLEIMGKSSQILTEITRGLPSDARKSRAKSKRFPSSDHHLILICHIKRRSSLVSSLSLSGPGPVGFDAQNSRGRIPIQAIGIF